jgi:hypothetical protein
MSPSRHAPNLAILAVLLAAACSDAAGPDTTTLAAVSPAPAATGVPPSATLTLTFSRPMLSGMEHYVDLHQGGVGGPVVPMTCTWNAGQTALGCTPAAPLAPGSQYTLHVGGGMTDERGRMMTVENWTSMGGQWATGGMMAGGHAGQPAGMMGSGWMHGSNHYGMLFEFTTS